MRKNGLREGGLFHAWMMSGRAGKMALARQGLVWRTFMQGGDDGKIIAACALLTSFSGSYGFTFDGSQAMQAIVFVQRRCDAPCAGAGVRRRWWLAIAGRKKGS
ncbi:MULTISPECIES: hypothetical protein [Comamonas]|uniref:hypothetical protein n=1 Tax=Comamonas TaxID=283 RepID=UPI0012BF7C06|nr:MULTISPECIES: hypothetical protein [Comamonas]MPT11339.1 hypothetical protein [Comamonas sp.]WQD42124.1 hypothetical protein U0024_20660 [Comamonas testosteroni]